ncbi:MAG TPA: HDOD domain-containing protein [Bryobacteraceae bacterium]|nr:HDOD domain-containing protein [Bryobacteraceae bacterium]
MNLGWAESPDSGYAAGVSAHCRRVAAWSDEIASAMGLSAEDRCLLQQAALSHHFPPVLLEDSSRARLLKDLRLEESGDRWLIPPDVSQILRGEGKLAAVLEIGDDFDEFYEAEPFIDPDAAEPWANSAVTTMLSYLQITSRADVNRVIDRLPVFPRAARNVLRTVSKPEVTLRELERAVAMDPVLAGLLIQTANSALYAPLRKVANIPHAIAYIGFEATRKVVLAGALRQNFASRRQHQVWNHSLEVAQAAERLAQASRLSIESADAFLAGLVHDIGSLAFSVMPASFLERFDLLTSRGCPSREVEVCLAGLCHAEAGAATLRQWKFPDQFIDAVRWHHCPERSSAPLGSLIYLAEFLTGSDEDLPSSLRLQAAAAQAGVNLDALPGLDVGGGYLEGLRFAA